MTQPPPGQGPIDPRGAFAPPPPPGSPQMQMPPGGMPSGGYMPPSMGFGPPGGFPPPGYPAPGGFPPPGWFPPPQKPKGGLGRALITTFATTIFGISLMLNVYLLLIGLVVGGHSSDKGNTTTVLEGDPKQVVAIVPIVTPVMITSEDAQKLDERLTEVEANENIKALVLRIDTPGGEVAPSDEMHERIMRFKAKRPGVPVVISMGGLCTSGGYYTAVAGDWLVAEHTTLTANIGVIQDSLNFNKLADKWGIEDTTLHNTGADFKATGSPWREPTTQEVTYMTGLLDNMADRFHQVVKDGREWQSEAAPGRLKAPLKDVFNAQAYPADVALKMGIIDQVGYLGDACTYAGKSAKLTNMTIIKFEEPSLLQKLFGNARSGLPAQQANGGSGGDSGGGSSGAVKINGVAVDSPQLDRLLNPRPLYLWRPN